MIAVTHSAATSPRSMTSLTAASLASHGVRAPISGHAGSSIATGPQQGAGAAYRGPHVAPAAVASAGLSPQVQAARIVPGSMASWAATTPGVSIAAAAQAALAAAATPAQPLGLVSSDSEDDSSDDSGSNDDADDSDAGADYVLLIGNGDQLQRAVSSWQAVHEPRHLAAESADRDAADAVSSAEGVSAAAQQALFRPGSEDSPPQPELVPVHAGQPAHSEPIGGAPALSGSAVQWVAADVAAQSSRLPGSQQSCSDGPTTYTISAMHSEAGPDEALPEAAESQAGLALVHTPMAKADTLTPVLSRPSRIPRPPSATPSSVMLSGRDSDGMAALRRSATAAATSRAVVSRDGGNQHSEGGAHVDAVGQQDAAHALEGANVDDPQEGEYSIAAVFDELALVAKLEAASPHGAAQHSAGVPPAILRQRLTSTG